MHWKATEYVLRYVRGTTSYGFHYVGSCTLYPIGYNDSYRDGNCKYQKSILAYVLSLGCNHICWYSKNQSSISLSLTGDE